VVLAFTVGFNAGFFITPLRDALPTVTNETGVVEKEKDGKGK
jgi:hypothetical protein